MFKGLSIKYRNLFIAIFSAEEWVVRISLGFRYCPQIQTIQQRKRRERRKVERVEEVSPFSIGLPFRKDG